MRKGPVGPGSPVTDRLAYLEALGIPVFERRDAPDPELVDRRNTPDPVLIERSDAAESGAIETADPQVGITLGPGDGSCLFLTGVETDDSAPLAADLARVLPGPPVWARLAESDGGQRLELVIAERLFTHVIVFGEAAGRLLFGPSIPETCGPARVTVVDDFARLATDAGARRSCWLAMKAAGVVGAS